MTVDAAPPFQAEIVPSSVAKIKDATLPLANRNTVVLLLTCPLGEDFAGPFVPAGIDTTNLTMVPAPL